MFLRDELENNLKTCPYSVSDSNFPQLLHVVNVLFIPFVWAFSGVTYMGLLLISASDIVSTDVHIQPWFQRNM